jgi:hypothetical protein
MKQRVFLLLVMLVALPGCYPYHFTMWPTVVGRVLDAQTQDPIAGALVTITHKDPYTHKIYTFRSLRTDANGVFRIPPFRFWTIKDTISPELHVGYDRPRLWIQRAVAAR